MITIIIPTYNAEKYLVKLLNGLQNQSIKNYELIIIDSSSKDETVNIAKQYTNNLTVIPQSEFDHGGTRNKALENVDTNIVVYATQDIILKDKYAIEKLIGVFEDKDVAVAYGRQLPHDNATYFAKQLRENNYPPKSDIVSIKDRDRLGFKTFFCSNSFAAYRVSTLKEIGGFKNNLLFGEDAYATAKILLNGYKKVYVAEAQIKHSHNYSIIEEFRRYFDIGVFHQTESWLITEFGTPMGEGLKYVKKEFFTLFKKGKLLLCTESILRNGTKFIAYKIGKNYRIVPLYLIKKFTMNKSWWDKQGDKK